MCQILFKELAFMSSFYPCQNPMRKATYRGVSDFQEAMAVAKPGNEPRWSGFFTAYEEGITGGPCWTHGGVAVKAKTNPTGSSGAGMALQSCPKFGQGG